MIDNFKKSLSFLLRDEGGNDDDPEDHGGRTSRGITQREYDAWRDEQALPLKDVWQATNDEVENIYHDEYWLPLCDTLPDGIDYLYFDMAVNAGPHRATILLQRALGVSADGRIGPVTRREIVLADPSELVRHYTEQKRKFYISLHQPRFLRGWLNRCDHVAANAATMIEG